MTPGGWASRHLGSLRSHRWELRSQLLALAMLPVIVFAIVWGAYVVQQRAADLQAQLQQRAQLLARQLAVAADYGIFSRNIVALQNLTIAVVKEPSVMSATIYDLNQEILASSQNRHNKGNLPETNIRDLMDQSVRMGKLPIGNRAARWVTYLEPVRSPTVVIEDLPDSQPSVPRQYIIVFAVVEVSSESIASDMLRFSLTVFSLLTGVLVISWLIVKNFSLRIDRRVQAVALAAQQIGEGKSGIRLGRSNITVFDHLSQDINRMSQQLELSRSELEQRVEQATLAMREQRDTAERANSAKTRFLAAASHDLRQPMHALNLLLTALQHEHAKPMRDELMQRIDATSKAMSGLLDALLDISRLDAGGVKPQVATFELLPLLLNVRETYEGLAQIKGIEFHVRPSRLCVHSDPMLIERILGNFVSNAIRYTPAGGRVLVAVRRRGQHCLLQVRDNGPGIEVKDQHAIFEEFVQIQNPQRDRSLGLGLGLAIVQRLAHLLKHPISLRSCPGHGSTFAIELPTRHQLPSKPQGVTATPGGPVNLADPATSSLLGGSRILLVEDDTQVRESYELLLRLWGCDVGSHESASAALEQLSRHDWTPQLIVADYRLGGRLNGVELIAAVRKQLSPTIPAVLITGNTEEPELRQLRDPTIRVLFKPVKPAELMNTLHELLRRAQIANPDAKIDSACN